MSAAAPRLAVRLATVNDRSLLHGLTVTRERRPARARRDAFPGWWEFEAQSILRDARPPKDRVLIGLLDERLVAACRWSLRGDHGHIDAVGVDPRHRGHHLGSTMVLHTIQEIRSNPQGSTPAALPVGLTSPQTASVLTLLSVTAAAHRENLAGLRTLHHAGMEAIDDEIIYPYVSFYRLA